MFVSVYPLSLSIVQVSADFSLYILIFSLAVLLISFAISYLANRKFIAAKRAALDQVRECAEGMESCSIENLSLLKAAAEKTGDEGLHQAFKRIEKESERLYFGKWVPESKHYLSFQNLLPLAKRRGLRPEIALNLVIIGVLATLVLILIPLVSNTPGNPALVIIPLLVSFFLAVFIYLSNRKSSQMLNDSILEMKRAYTRTLPEYSEHSGTALLIDEFKQYDRRMADSTTLLSSKVEQLSDQNLVDAVSGSIEKILERHIAPALAESNQALSRLCVELTDKQSSGIETLSRDFSASLATTITESLRPLEGQVKAYTDEVGHAKNSLTMAFEQFDNYRKQADALDSQILSHIALLDDQSKQWNEGLSGLRTVSESISANNQEMTKLQGGSEETLAGKLAMMAEAIENFGQMNHDTMQGLREENALLNKLLIDTQAESSKVLSEYRHLTQRITISAMDIEKHNGEISENIVKLSTGLDDSVKHFTSQLQSGVDVTLSDFDSGLAELTERLSHSATAIRDSVARLVDAVSNGTEG